MGPEPRWLAIMIRTMAIAAYIQGIEEKVVGDMHGWETILKSMRKKNPIKSQLEGWMEAITWSLAVIGLACPHLVVRLDC